MLGECPRTPEERIGCPFAPNCYSNQHHRYWPARNYKTPVERLFRELPENKEQICMWNHQEAHYDEPPEKPDLIDMLRALGRLTHGDA